MNHSFLSKFEKKFQIKQTIIFTFIWVGYKWRDPVSDNQSKLHQIMKPKKYKSYTYISKLLLKFIGTEPEYWERILRKNKLSMLVRPNLEICQLLDELS